MQNKIILEFPDKTEATIDNVDFIKIEGSDNTIRIKAKSVENFKALKGLLIGVFGNNNQISLGKIFYPVNETVGLTGLTVNIGNPPDDTLAVGM